MRKLALTTAALTLLAGMAGAEPLMGNWRTAPDDNGNTGIVTVTQCGAALCGTLTTAFDSSGNVAQSDMLGRQIIWDTTPSGGGEYAGRIYAPDRDREYRSRLVLQGDALIVSGCVMGGAICREEAAGSA